MSALYHIQICRFVALVYVTSESGNTFLYVISLPESLLKLQNTIFLFEEEYALTQTYQHAKSYIRKLYDVIMLIDSDIELVPSFAFISFR